MDDLSGAPLADFDAALPLSPLGPRAWASQVDKRYWNAIGPWGGWTAALLLKAVLAEADHNGTPVAMTINLMGGLDEQPLAVMTLPVVIASTREALSSTTEGFSERVQGLEEQVQSKTLLLSAVEERCELLNRNLEQTQNSLSTASSCLDEVPAWPCF